MNQDIDAALEGWDFKAGVVQARLVQARNGRQVIQMRVDLGVLQIETGARPMEPGRTATIPISTTFGSKRGSPAVRNKRSRFPRNKRKKPTANSCSIITGAFAGWRCGITSGPSATRTTPSTS